MRWYPKASELAADQHGVVTRLQLLRGGISRGTIDRALKTGLLQSLHPGVYRIGPSCGRLWREMAAVLACAGDAAAGTAARAAVGLENAAAVRQMIRARPASEPIRILVSGGGLRARGVLVKRVRTLWPDEVTRLEGVPVTTAARTLLDLAATTGPWELERIVANAERGRLITFDELRTLTERHPRHSGRRRLRSLLADTACIAFTRSEAEKLLLELMAKAGLPAPRANIKVLDLEVDFVWHAQRLIVEVDGFAYHCSETSFEHDRSRDAQLLAAGWRVVRFTWNQITKQPEQTIARIAQALVVGGGRDRA